ncbi:glycosyltransferase family 4 protein [Larkinella terrae]|uniref:Glycosyltransferase n=1 Tax=Larkinella terrae TaxID=2025311 RepID=A0A7K0EUP9_9BACT|nr:glycosyltransferase family 4 protein [Larkinella terrae]MRS65534.1 glycosyltransferase [Larkinella terrae]
MKLTDTVMSVKTYLIPRSIAERVLVVGPQHQNYQGGIGYLIHIYSQYFEAFKFVTTHKLVRSKTALILYFLRQYSEFVGKLSKDSKIRIVHIHGSSYGSFYRKLVLFLTSKYLFGQKVIYHMNGSEFATFYQESNPVRRKLIRFMVENVDVVLCLSKSWERFFKQNFHAKRVEILYNIVDHRHVPKKVWQKKPGEVLKVLFLGAIGPRKGVFDLLDVISQNRSLFQGQLQLIIGGNGETEQLENYIREHQLEQIVAFEGWVVGQHKARLLTDCHLFVLPSYSEGVPFAILEAMSYGLPILSTPVGGTAEVVREGENGFLVQPGDKAALFHYLKKFLNEPALLERMGRESGRICRSYRPETVLPQLLRIYESILN